MRITDLTAPTLFGMKVIVNNNAFASPSPGEWARRYVRHGMAEILEWLDEPVGPKPDEPVPAAFILPSINGLIAHPAIVQQIRNASLPNDIDRSERVTPQ